MTAQKPKILLSEGSSLSSREVITALGLAGHRIDLISCDPMCLGRFSRFVRRVHRAPASGADPDGYLAKVIETVKTSGANALFPVHEQAYLFAAARKQLPPGLGIALADFEAFEQVQSKASLAALLTKLKVPQPKTDVVRSADEFSAMRPFPLFVKAAFGTASAYRGSREELAPLLTDPLSVIPLGVVVMRLLRTPAAAARFSETTVAAYSLTPSAIRRLHAWRHAG